MTARAAFQGGIIPPPQWKCILYIVTLTLIRQFREPGLATISDSTMRNFLDFFANILSSYSNALYIIEHTQTSCSLSSIPCHVSYELTNPITSTTYFDTCCCISRATSTIFKPIRMIVLITHQRHYIVQTSGNDLGDDNFCVLILPSLCS